MSTEQHSYEYWLGATETKYSLSGVERTVRPSVTIKRARRVMEAVGVTKVAEVTDLDRVGIPNFMTVRPHDAAQGISYYSGKGTTRADAHAGALMEAIERHAGESYTGTIVPSSYYNLRGDYPCVDPLEIQAPLIAGYSEDLLLEWVPGFDLLNRQRVLVPLNCVVAPYRPIAGEQLFFTSTNGLASGNTRLEAVCHALCEVVERDAMAVALARSAVRPVVQSILAEMGFSGQVEADSGAPDLAQKGLPRKAAALVRKLQQAGLAIRLRNLTSGTGIPTISCTIVDPQAPPTALNAHSGCGTHPDARIALTRALTEAAQTRVTFIQGGREDLADMAPNRGASSAAELPAADGTIAFEEIDSREHPTINEDVEFMLERLCRSGFGQVIVVDLTKAGIDIPVVRVVVPRAETWSFFFAHTGRASVGSRALDRICAPD